MYQLTYLGTVYFITTFLKIETILAQLIIGISGYSKHSASKLNYLSSPQL